jgi:hypothetical protein
MAQAITQVEVPEVNQPPFYARISGGGGVGVFGPLPVQEIYHNDEWAAIAFYRDPATVPQDFNLLEFFDLRLWTPEIVSRLTIEGFEIWEAFPPTPESRPAPIAAKWNGLGAVPIWFVSWPELAQAVTDGQLTMPDVSSMQPKKGSASLYTEHLYPPEVFEVPGIVIDARGYLDDGTGFRFNAAVQDFDWTGSCCSSDHPAQFVHIAFDSTPSLLPGDADQDADFDQLDLVQVQVAGKYLTGQAATWGQGDWNGAPGGSKGNPPPGNGRFDQSDIIAALASNRYLTGAQAAVRPSGARGDGQTSLVYNPGTGELAVDAPAAVQLTSINIDSASGVFTGAPAMNLGGSFDNDANNNIFKATFGSSFGSLSFGNVAQSGLAEQFVLNDLTVVGSLAGGGDLGNVDLIYVPEPSTVALVAMGLLSIAGLIVHRRARIVIT